MTGTLTAPLQDFGGSVAAACNIRCPTSFVNFYDRTAHTAMVAMPDLMPQYQALYATCSDVPLDQLL